MKIHCFQCDTCAYDACQTDENIKDGDLLIIIAGEFDPIYALAGTWPTRIIGAEWSCMHEGFSEQQLNEYAKTFTFAQTLHQAQIENIWPVVRECICV